MNPILSVILALSMASALVGAAPIPADAAAAAAAQDASGAETQYYSTWDLSQLDAIFDPPTTAAAEEDSDAEAAVSVTLVAPAIPADLGQQFTLTGPAYSTWGPGDFESFMGSDFSLIASFYPDYTPTGHYGAAATGAEAYESTPAVESPAAPTGDAEQSPTPTDLDESSAASNARPTSTVYVYQCPHIKRGSA
ncbi:hypothetical protein H4217_008480 [Coemansia sp. RSA 1939]|nr:hypothetical protein H4217_008480 [Coemansia sp. RSA 1939]